jgi:hypothetical protein
MQQLVLPEPMAPEHSDACEESSLRDHEPLRMLCRTDRFCMVDLADDEAEAFALARFRAHGNRISD